MLFRLIHIVAFVLLEVSSAHSQSVTATDDSTRVAEIIYNVTHSSEGISFKKTGNAESMIVAIGKQLLGTPYVGKTLEVNPTTRLHHICRKCTRHLSYHKSRKLQLRRLQVESAKNQIQRRSYCL